MGTFIKKLRKKKGLNRPNWDKKHIQYEKNRREKQSKEAKKKENEN